MEGDGPQHARQRPGGGLGGPRNNGVGLAVLESGPAGDGDGGGGGGENGTAPTRCQPAAEPRAEDDLYQFIDEEEVVLLPLADDDEPLGLFCPPTTKGAARRAYSSQGGSM